jgi:hypothetical protein
MARTIFARFTDPDWLRTIDGARLGRFLLPWQDYLAQRGVVFSITDHCILDPAVLVRVLASPDEATPRDMIDALYAVRETASDDHMEELLTAARTHDIHLPDGPDLGASDIAIEMWLADPEIVRARQAQAFALETKSFVYFASKGGAGGPFPSVDDGLRNQFEQACDVWFATHRRGRGCRLYCFDDQERTWLTIRHGQTMRREAIHQEDGSVGSELYRPQRHDVLIYDPSTGELGINAGTKGERALYLRTLGEVMYGDADRFPSRDKYSLEPLIADGAKSLSCCDIEGLKRVALIEYKTFWGGQYGEVETRRARDIFAALERRPDPFLRGPTPVQAKFSIDFHDARKCRTVTIRPPWTARYERNEDSVAIERWLRARGFMA